MELNLDFDWFFELEKILHVVEGHHIFQTRQFLLKKVYE